jgi:DNA polymerase III delta prime subunit
MGFIIDQRKEKYKDVWLEKYRPDDIEKIVMEDGPKKKFKEYLEEEDFPSLLFVGPSGTGKTTMAYILLDKAVKDDMDYLELNGSLNGGKNTIRDFDDFIKSMTMSSKRKYIFIDEADKLTNDAQDALRNLVEQNSDHLSFVFTANYEYKITDALKSRFQTFKFKRMPKDYVEKFISEILDKENITYKKEDLEYIIKATYPDMRKGLNEINKVVYRDVNDSKILSLGNAGCDFLIEQRFLETLLRIENNYKQNLNYIDDVRQAYEIIKEDAMDYLTAFEKMNEEFRTIKLKTLTSKYYNEVNKVISPKFLMMTFLGEYLEHTLK